MNRFFMMRCTNNCSNWEFVLLLSTFLCGRYLSRKTRFGPHWVRQVIWNYCDGLWCKLRPERFVELMILLNQQSTTVWIWQFGQIIPQHRHLNNSRIVPDVQIERKCYDVLICAVWASMLVAFRSTNQLTLHTSHSTTYQHVACIMLRKCMHNDAACSGTRNVPSSFWNGILTEIVLFQWGRLCNWIT